MGNEEVGLGPVPALGCWEGFVGSSCLELPKPLGPPSSQWQRGSALQARAQRCRVPSSSPAVTLGWAAQPFCGSPCLAGPAKRCLSSYLILPPGCRRGRGERGAPPAWGAAVLSPNGAGLSPARGRDAGGGTAECGRGGRGAGGVHPLAAVAIPLLSSCQRFSAIPLASACIWLGAARWLLCPSAAPPCPCQHPRHLLQGGRAAPTAGCSPPRPQEPCNGCCSAEGAPIAPYGPG